MFWFFPSQIFFKQTYHFSVCVFVGSQTFLSGYDALAGLGLQRVRNCKRVQWRNRSGTGTTVCCVVPHECGTHIHLFPTDPQRNPARLLLTRRQWALKISPPWSSTGSSICFFLAGQTWLKLCIKAQVPRILPFCVSLFMKAVPH